MDKASAPPREDVLQKPPFGAVVVRMAWVAGLVALDLWSKAWVFARLGPPGQPTGGVELDLDVHAHGRETLIGDWLAFMTSLNPGMAWGFDKLPMHVLVYGRLAAVLLLIWMVARNSTRRPWMTAALVLVLAGAMGNLYDNLFTDYKVDLRGNEYPFGQVRDFIDVYFARWQWHFPTFNVADSCISVGAVLLFLVSWKKEAAPTANA
ncbi:MAG TPA: signal peptidase II [Planctomycetota bacterium]|nr:signal peptidase II [Planctomycetota bacterium]